MIMQAEGKKKLLNILGFVLKVVVTGFILWSIFRKMDMHILWTNLVNKPVWLLAIIMAVSGLRHWGQYLTWKYSLQMNPLYIPKPREIFSSYMIGQALRFIIPGSYGIVGKIAFVSNSSKTASFISYMIERVFVTWALMFFASFALLFTPIGIPQWVSWLLFVIFLAIPFGGYFVLGANRRWQRLQPNYLVYGPRVLVMQIGVTLLNYLQYWLLLHHMVPTSYWETLKRMSLAHISYSIPVTFAGLGLKEYFAKTLFSSIGYPEEVIVSTTLILFFLHDILAALAGAVFLLQAKYSKT
jgi:hypothetical protein